MPPPVYSTTLIPDVIGQTYDRARVLRTIASPQETAGDQSRAMGGTNILWRYSLGWNPLKQTNAEALLHATEFMGGDTLGLYFFEWEVLAWLNVFVGKGNGSATTFDLPVKGASAGTTAVRVNGTPTSVAFQSGTGPNGEDRIVFSPAPANGAEIRADFTGRRRRKVRLDDGTTFELELTARFDGSGSPLWIGAMTLIETDGTDLL